MTAADIRTHRRTLAAQPWRSTVRDYPPQRVVHRDPVRRTLLQRLRDAWRAALSELKN